MRMESTENHHFFPLTSLQIGDLQSYLSSLSLYLAPESSKIFILVDNRPWLLDQHSRPAHLWQLMVTKSRLSPFANTRGRPRRKDLGWKLDFRSSYRSNPSIRKNLRRWFSIIDAAISQKKALLPVLPVLPVKELHRTLYGFIVFEVAWANVRGINYLNELQTETSLALEAKYMKRWEFDSIEQASCFMSSWFVGTLHEYVLLQDFLNNMSDIGEVFYDAPEGPFTANPSDDYENLHPSDDCGNLHNDEEFLELKPFVGVESHFNCYPDMECKTGLPFTPPPTCGPNKRRKIAKCTSSGNKVDVVSERVHAETMTSPRTLQTLICPDSLDYEKASTVFEATHYRDVLILVRFNDRDLPFKLRDIIMPNLRLLTLLESGLPSWVIFLQSYPVFCQFYRPWMCPLARALYVMISIITVLIGFYDLYKNVPVLKATASRLCGPLFDWIETWEMLSRIKYLGTMLVLHNCEKAVKRILMTTNSMKSLVSVLAKPMAEPLVEPVGFLLPFWSICLQNMESFISIIWIFVESSCSIAVDLVQILLWPMWAILSVILSIATSIVYPIFWALCEVLIAPIRLLLALTNYGACLVFNIFYMIGEICLTVNSMLQLTSASEASSGAYEISMWHSLWNDLFSQIFRAVRSIIYGFVAFFQACNRHRLSIYNHMQEFVLRLSCLCRSGSVDSTSVRWKYIAQNPFEAGRKVLSKPPQQLRGRRTSLNRRHGRTKALG